MYENINFYKFMHKQIFVIISLTLLTAGGYIFIGYLYGSVSFEIIWFLFDILLSLWGYRLYKMYSHINYTVDEKERWLTQVKYFFFFYSHIWTIMFVKYTLTDNIDLHYVAIATQLGTSVVSVTMLASQRKLSIVTLVTLMLPLTIYFIIVGELYSYLLAFFTIVLAWVLLYAANNTRSYIIKSQYQAYHDYLTKLGNRHYFTALLENSIKIQTNDRKPVYLLLIDLDHFKSINDSLGHDVGDTLLQEVAQRMKKLSDKYSNSVSRLGGDEFCILSHSFEDKELCLESALEFANELLEVIKETYIIEEHHLYISASIGVSIINSPDMKAATFLKEADIAMYDAKNKGRDGVILFNEDLSIKVERRLEIENLLHFAIENKEITLVYQPQINSKDNIVGCEVLVRWYNETLGHVPPDEFIPISEDTGFIIELGQYIFEEAIKTLKEWNDKGIKLEQISINISMRQLFHDEFIENVKELCINNLSKEQTSKIIFEITETSVADDVAQLIKNMNTLKECGIRFSMDDFGTGYSSLSYLKQIPIDELKIDKSFVTHLGSEDDDEAIVRTILDIAKNLQLSVVAEGVENSDQKEFLINNDCDILQGYHFARPMSKTEFESLKTNNKIK